MRLPGNSIGITDILGYRDCPSRFAFGMRRHTPAGEHPEAQTHSTAYGSAIHEAIAWAEDVQATDEEAIQRAFDKYARWLDPVLLERLRKDMRTYRERDYTGVRTIAVEREVRMPLFEHDGETIYFRAKIDRLYQRLDNPGVFIHVDYKSSGHARSEADIHGDLQMWAYNALIHEFWPECEQLVQIYDQLSFGAIPTRKTPEQRQQIRDWLVKQITAILHDDELAPTYNRWCRWCALMPSCPVPPSLTESGKATIDAMAPPGEDTSATLEPYVAKLDEVADARKLLAAWEDTVKGVLKDMPDGRRAELGYQTRPRMTTSWPPESLRAAHELLGDEFYELVGLTKSRAEKHPDGAALLALAERQDGPDVLVKMT
jgi:hypothetical protein